MYRFIKDGVSVLTVVDKRRKKNNGLYPVKIEVVYRRHQRYYPSGQDVTLEEWESMWSSRRINDKMSDIERNFNKVRCIVDSLVKSGSFSFSALDARMGRTAVTVNEAIQARMKSLYEEGRINSFYRYRSMLHAIETYKGYNILFSEIDERWLKRCESTWIKEGKSSTTINIYMKSLRCICREAVEYGNLREGQDPFRKGGYKIPAGRRRTMALDKEQIRRIINWRGDEKICYWRDLWVFSYLCNGINFRDMLYLKYGDITEGEISFIRSKTSSCPNPRVIRAAITPLMGDIMERCGKGRTGPAGRIIFRHAGASDSGIKKTNVVRAAIMSCNNALKIIADELKIPHFTTYSARHSYATVLMRGGIDIQYISESLGHTSIRMTENYLAGFDKEDRLRNSRFLSEFA